MHMISKKTLSVISLITSIVITSLIFIIKFVNDEDTVFEMPLILVSGIYLFLLKHIDEKSIKSFLILPSYLLLYISILSLVNLIIPFNNLIGLLSLIPIAIGIIYIIIKSEIIKKILYLILTK
jgi:hypothetical protein